MTCTNPLKAYRPLSKIDGGRYVFNAAKALNPDNPTLVPCGVCQSCRVARSRDWAIRCMHESQMHPVNTFATLTFSDEHLPKNYSVDVRDVQLFMKRLRKKFSSKIRFLACGEYGDKFLRPHYHLLLFNHIFTDQQFYKHTPQGDRLYTSEDLDTLWPFGQAILGDLTYQSAAYCARYVMKKITGDRADEHYVRLHPITNTLHVVKPEFQVSSTNPGLGSTWFDKFKDDAFPSDFLIVDGKKHPVPKYYLKKLQQEEAAPDETKPYFKSRAEIPSFQITRKRVVDANGREKLTPQKLRARAEIVASRLSMLKRNL
ncbi:MAG: replication initiator protein [Microvirus sp.]|nr:MAG: replication initiator protein [Microvirus sp.]